MLSQYLWKALQRAETVCFLWGQKVVAVYRCHETCQVRMFLHILVVGHTVFDHRAGNEVFKLVLVTLVESFKLVVNIYDEILPDIGKRVLLLRIYLARVIVTM